MPPCCGNALSERMTSERGIWQRRFWEHTIKDERDSEHHVDNIHFNPVKHGADWGAVTDVAAMELE